MRQDPTRTCAVLVDLPDVRVLGAFRDGANLTVHVETLATTAGRPDCGVLASVKVRVAVSYCDLPVCGLASDLVTSISDHARPSGGTCQQCEPASSSRPSLESASSSSALHCHPKASETPATRRDLADLQSGYEDLDSRNSVIGENVEIEVRVQAGHGLRVRQTPLRSLVREVRS